MNVCTFIGRLGKDPDMRYTTSGKAVVSFSLAVNRDGKRDETDWIDFVAWEKAAELISQYCHKGDLIGVTGSLYRKEWEKDIPAVYDILKRGCETAREVAADTLADVRRAMRINYFDDAELIAEQARKFQG